MYLVENTIYGICLIRIFVFAIYIHWLWCCVVFLWDTETVTCGWTFFSWSVCTILFSASILGYKWQSDIHLIGVEIFWGFFHLGHMKKHEWHYVGTDARRGSTRNRSIVPDPSVVRTECGVGTGPTLVSRHTKQHGSDGHSVCICKMTK